jgi:hypothetical protein
LRYLVLLFFLVVTPALAQEARRSLQPHDCLGATATNTVTIASGTTSYGDEIRPLGSSEDQSGFVSFAGSGKMTITVQTRRARGAWCTPTVGATPLYAVDAGSYNFVISVPPCDSLRLAYTATVADVGVTDASVLER